jgi:hypothetical protein
LDKTQLAELAERFLLGTATEKEIALLHEWYDTADKEEIELVFTPEPETAEAVGKRLFGRVAAGHSGGATRDAPSPYCPHTPVDSGGFGDLRRCFCRKILLGFPPERETGTRRRAG